MSIRIATLIVMNAFFFVGKLLFVIDLCTPGKA